MSGLEVDCMPDLVFFKGSMATSGNSASSNKWNTGLPHKSLALGFSAIDPEHTAALVDGQLDVPSLDALVADATAAILAARRVRIAC